MKTLLVICGGRSAEHDISLRSAKTILKELDRTLFTPKIVGISRCGLWYFLPDESKFFTLENLDALADESFLCSLERTKQGVVLKIKGCDSYAIDGAFPILHGPYGEDGSIQGLFDMLDLPYVGSGVAASALGMDKEFFKVLMTANDVSVVPFITCHDPKNLPNYATARAQLGDKTLFIKPTAMGSSIGIYKVKDAQSYDEALSKAFHYSTKVLIEKAIQGQEVECALLGNDPYDVTDICEIISCHDFYSYEAKYLDPEGASFDYQPCLSQDIQITIKVLAQKSAHIIGCRGLARVDFFVADGQVYLNEINTMPGFTSISMYPQLWNRQGLNTTDLITKLINLAYAEHQRKQTIRLVP